MRCRWFHYVRLGDLADWLKCGWLPRPALVNTHHGFYAVLCEWPCGCQMARPGTTALSPQNRPTGTELPKCSEVL